MGSYSAEQIVVTCLDRLAQTDTFASMHDAFLVHAHDQWSALYAQSSDAVVLAHAAAGTAPSRESAVRLRWAADALAHEMARGRDVYFESGRSSLDLAVDLLDCVAATKDALTHARLQLASSASHRH